MSPILNRTHGMCGAAAGAWLGVATQAVGTSTVPVAVGGVAVGLVGALAPDFDHLDASPVRAWELTRWRFRGARWLGIPKFTLRIGIGPLISAALRALSQLATGRKHRGLTHSLFFGVVLGLVVGLFAGIWLPGLAAAHLGVAMFLGVAAALAGDAVTPGGLKHVFWPVEHPIRVPRHLAISVGGLIERWVVFPIFAAVTGLGVAVLVLGWSVILGG